MIRKVTAEDKALYLELIDEFYHSSAVLHPIPRAHYVDSFDEMCRTGGLLEGYIIEYGEKAAGYAAVARSYSTEAGGLVVWIEEVYIRPAFQSKGLGRAFFDHMKELYPEAKRFRLEVERDNTRAIALYERLGYEVLDYVQMVQQ
jgi:ribosomal protein S18 acetylase RimI-like enzyme